MGKPDVPHPPGLGFYEFSFFSAGEMFPTSLIFFFILFLFLIVFPRQFPICICDNFFSLCAVSLALLLFFYFLLHLILSQFSLFFLGGFCFPHFQWAFVWLSDLPWLVVLFLFFVLLLCRVFLETKGKSFWCYLLRIFSPYIIIIFFFFLPRRVWVETLIGIKSVIWATHKF